MNRIAMNPIDRARAVEEILGFKFTELPYLDTALRLAGSGPRDNKNLSQVGDSVLRLAFVTEGYKGGVHRSVINPLLDRVSGNQNIAKIGFEKGLDQFVYKNPSQYGNVSPGPMASTVEALLGAVFLDSGEDIDAVRRVMLVLGLSWPTAAN